MNTLNFSNYMNVLSSNFLFPALDAAGIQHGPQTTLSSHSPSICHRLILHWGTVLLPILEMWTSTPCPRCFFCNQPHYFTYGKNDSFWLQHMTDSSLWLGFAPATGDWQLCSGERHNLWPTEFTFYLGKADILRQAHSAVIQDPGGKREENLGQQLLGDLQSTSKTVQEGAL